LPRHRVNEEMKLVICVRHRVGDHPDELNADTSTPRLQPQHRTPVANGPWPTPRANSRSRPSRTKPSNRSDPSVVDHVSSVGRRWPGLNVCGNLSGGGIADQASVLGTATGASFLHTPA